MQREDDAPAHIVVMATGVGDQGSIDVQGRLRNIATSLADAGAHVTVLVGSDENEREVHSFGGVDVLRVPIPVATRNLLFALRTHVARVVHTTILPAVERRILRLLGSIRDWLEEMHPPDQVAFGGVLPRSGRFGRVRGIGHGVASRVLLPAFNAGMRWGTTAWRAIVPHDRHVPLQRDPRAVERALGAALAELQPEAVHAVGDDALRAAELAGRAASNGVRPFRLVFDQHGPEAADAEGAPATRKRASSLLSVDAVIADSELAAEWLMAEHGLTESPLVVHDPLVRLAGGLLAKGTVREASGADPEAPLLACLVEDADADLEPILAALPHVPHVMCTFMIPIGAPELNGKIGLAARRLGCRAQVRVVKAPPPELMRAYLEDATAAIFPARTAVHRPIMPTAYLASLQARVPTLVAARSAAAGTTRDLQSGVVVEADDPAAWGGAMAEVCDERQRYVASLEAAQREAARLFSWEAQSDPLVKRYSSLLGRALQADRGPARGEDTFGGRLGIGPRNGNGQAWAWAEALRTQRPDVPAEVFAVEYSTGALEMQFASDYTIPLKDWKSRDWQLWWARHVIGHFSHLLLEQALSVWGYLNGRHFHGDLPFLRDHGLEVALMFRGSELRNPRRHAEREPLSPFADPWDPLTMRLQAQVDALQPHLDAFGGPCFVTTLDLLDDLPTATWCPQVLDLDVWSLGPRALQRRVPVVVHAPTREKMKGSRAVDKVCEPLADAGLIEYRRLRGIPYREMPDVIRDADVVIDQFPVGSYGVLALQAMATGRVVIGNVNERVRQRLDGNLPIVQATSQTLPSVLDEILSAREHFGDLGFSGRAYIERYHSGPHSAGVLLPFLGLDSDRQA